LLLAGEVYKKKKTYSADDYFQEINARDKEFNVVDLNKANGNPEQRPQEPRVALLWILKNKK